MKARLLLLQSLLLLPDCCVVTGRSHQALQVEVLCSFLHDFVEYQPDSSVLLVHAGPHRVSFH
jgi:hypothetical protein